MEPPEWLDVDPAHQRHTRIHSGHRARQRFDLKLSRNRRAEILTAIQRGRAEYLYAEPSSGRSTWRVEVKGKWWAKIVVDRTLSQIVTVMTDRRTI
jgi:hypothetical protein